MVDFEDTFFSFNKNASFFFKKKIFFKKINFTLVLFEKNDSFFLVLLALWIFFFKMSDRALQHAKQVANDTFISRSNAFNLYDIKTKGKALVTQQHERQLEELNAKRRKLITQWTYADMSEYTTDSRVDDFLAYKQIETSFFDVQKKISKMSHTEPEKLWLEQVGHLKADFAGSLAVLNATVGQVQEEFPIDPERCKCGRSYHYNGTLSMNFCPVHKVYKAVLTCGEEKHSKPKQPTNTSNKQHRLVITPQNQIIAANNPLYKERMQRPMEHVARLRLTVHLAHPPKQPKSTTSHVNKKQSKKLPKQQGKPPKPPKPTKVKKPPKVKKQKREYTAPVIVIVNNPTPKQQQEPPRSSKISEVPKPIVTKLQTKNKFVSAYEKYLSQFAPDAPTMPLELMQQIHNAMSGLYFCGESRLTNEITKIIASQTNFAAFKHHVPRILKLYRGIPVPVIDCDLRNKLIKRYELIYKYVNEELGADSSGKKRKHIPCDESLTHIFLICEDRMDLATAFDLHPTMKVTPEQMQRFRNLIETVCLQNNLSWKFDFPISF